MNSEMDIVCGLKVLYFSSANHIQGGAVQSLFRMARWLKQRGGEPVVILPRMGGITEWYAREGIEVRSMKFVELHKRKSPLYLLRYAVSTLWLILRLVKLIRAERIDLVHVNEITYWPALIAGKIARRRTICHIRVIISGPNLARRLLTGIAQNFSDTVICVSEAVRAQMFGSERSNVCTLHNPGPDLSRFDPSRTVDKDQVRRELGVSEESFLVGLTAKFVSDKGHCSLIEAGRLLAERKPPGDFVFLLIGGQVPGHEAYYAELRQLIKQYSLEESVVLTGAREDVPSLMGACDVLVHLPLHEDPFPGVVLEAMAMEKPIIAYRSGGVVEQFEHGSSGILVEKGDFKGVADALAGLSTDETKRKEMGRRASLYLKSSFSYEKFFGELEGIYARRATRSQNGCPLESA